MDHRQHLNRLYDPHLANRIHDRLALDGVPDGWGQQDGNGHQKGSAVLVLITPCRVNPDGPAEPCLLLNKRSTKVLQPGDLCCPGGGVGKLDRALSGLLRWPPSPLYRWPQWKKWRTYHPLSARELEILLFTGLREGWEEMRLNPFNFKFLGCLPVQQLVMFERHIFPLAGWLEDHHNLTLNWEVERIVLIPIRRLMNPRNYGRFSLTYNMPKGICHRKDQFPCFVHQGKTSREVLWGATFRIVMDFLNLVFGFRLPDLRQSPVMEKQLGQAYLNGSRMRVTDRTHLDSDDDF